MAIPKKTTLGGLILATIAGLFAVEQGYSNDPRDPGGATNHGITEKVARADGYEGDMKDLTQDRASEIYAKDYIHAPGFTAILSTSPALGQRVIDGGVNVGTRQMSLWFQRGLDAMCRSGKDCPRVVADGKIGPGTMAAYAALEKKRGRVQACQAMIKVIDGQQTVHYMSLGKPEFVYGWVTNRIGHVPLERCNEAPVL